MEMDIILLNRAGSTDGSNEQTPLSGQKPEETGNILEASEVFSH